MQKATIHCPKCGNQIQVPNDRHIKFNCVNASCQEDLEVKNGLLISPVKVVNQGAPRSNVSNRFRENEARSRREEADAKSMRMKRIFAFLGLLVFAFIAYIFLTKETSTYNKFLEKPTINSADSYLRNYKDGKYTAEVNQIRDSILYFTAYNRYVDSKKRGSSICSTLKQAVSKMHSFNLPQANSDYEECLYQRILEEKDFKSIDKYKTVFPEGIYKDSLSGLEKGVWTNLHTQYETRTDSLNISKEAKRFVKELLSFAEKTGEKEIDIVFESETNLKDWLDYTEEERAVVDTLVNFSNMLEGLGYPLPSNNNPPSISRGFTNINTYSQKRIVKAFQNRLDSVFFPNPFVILENQNNVIEPVRPTILLDYKIETLSEKYEKGTFPSLYIHTEEDPYNRGNGVNKRNTFKGYLLATGIQWDLKFTVPESKEKIKMSSYSRPQSNFSNIRSTSQIYKVMMESAFQNYADKVADDIGL